MQYQMHLNPILANGLSLIPSLLMLQALVERLAINLMFPIYVSILHTN